MDPKDILQRRDKAKGDRDRMEMIFDDAIRLTMPARKRFTEISGANTADDIFDETGVNAAAEFVSRMQAGLVPAFTEFVNLEADSSVAAKDRRAVNRDLEEIQHYMFEEIWNSNFHQESSESFHDLSISTGIMLHEEGDGDQTFRHRAIPITEVLLERGLDDLVGGLFREHEVKAAMLPVMYSSGKFEGRVKEIITKEPDKPVKVIEYTHRDYKQRTETHRHIVMIEEHKEVIVDRTLTGAGSNPFHTFRWATAAGEIWSRGPVLNALGAIRTTNLMVEMILENAAMSIVGIYQTDNDGVVNGDNISLLPGTIMNREPGSRGLEPVQGNTGNFNMQQLVLNDQRINIKRALFNDMLSDPNKTPASATEVAERMADLAYRTSAGFARVFYEFIQPYIRRCLYILEKRGDIEMPTLNGKGIRVRAVSPLAQAQNGRELQMFMQHHQMVAGIWGPQVGAMMYDMQETLPWLQQKMVLDGKLYKDAKTIAEQMAAAMQQAQQQQQEGQPGAMNVSN